MEMGFDEKEVIDALRVNNNQQTAAVSSRPSRSHSRRLGGRALSPGVCRLPGAVGYPRFQVK